jgi:hypothetical protein
LKNYQEKQIEAKELLNTTKNMLERVMIQPIWLSLTKNLKKNVGQIAKIVKRKSLEDLYGDA